MSFVLNNAITTDNYSDANTLKCPDTVKSRIWIFNNGVFMKVARRVTQGPHLSQQAPQDSPELFMAPGLYSLIHNVERIAFRSAVSGSPGNVTVESLTPGE